MTLNVQNAKALAITEGDVKTIHDKDARLLWGAVGYSTKYEGDTKQQSYSGKNLCDLSVATPNSSTLTIDGGTITVTRTSASGTPYARVIIPLSENATYTFSCSASGDINSDVAIVGRLYVDGSLDPDTNRAFALQGTGSQSVTFSTRSGTTSVYIYYRASVSVAEAVATFTDNQLEAGSTATPYEPYVGGIPAPNPDYPEPISVVQGEQKVTLTGKNLFNINNTLFDNSRATHTLNGNELTVTATVDGSAYTGIFLPNSTELLGKTCVMKIRNVTTSATNTSKGRIAIYQSKTGGTSASPAVKSFTVESGSTGTITFPDTFSSGKDAFVVLFYSSDGNPSVTGDKSTYSGFQLELGSTATSYEQYQSKSCTVGLTSKNLFDLETAVTRFENSAGTVQTGGATYSDGVVTMTWTVGGQGRRLMAGFKPTLVEGVTYTLSAEVYLTGSSEQNRVSMGSISTWGIVETGYKNTWVTISKSFTATAEDVADSRMLIEPSNTGNELQFKNVQLEVNSQPTSYTPYFTPIELAKVGDYQDYIWKDGSDWKIHKEVGKKILNGSNADIEWTRTTGTGFYAFWFRNYTTDAKPIKYLKISNNFTYSSDGYTTAPTPSLCENTYTTAETNFMFVFKTDGTQATTVSDWETWLSAHNTTVYYALATATDTEITDTTLTSQLDAIEQWLIRYGYQGTVTGDLPIIINRTELS